ncbi:MAG: hypothetical protein JWL97_3607 [Gemmatimonadales bacterium]|nr:hypothetical protein [Gemmatimonadales bacterium]
MVSAVFKTDGPEDLGPAGSIPVRLRHLRLLDFRRICPAGTLWRFASRGSSMSARGTKLGMIMVDVRAVWADCAPPWPPGTAYRPAS